MTEQLAHAATAESAAARDEGYAPSRWAFDGEVARVFDDMLARSVPQYEVMRRACFELACRYVRQGTAIVDLGCARGEALVPFLDRFGAQNRYVAVEVSRPMADAARQRFRGWIDCGIAEVRSLDLRHEYPPVRASVTLCVLTLQFTPIEYRQRLLRRVFETTVPGGALVLVEKVLGAAADLDTALTERYYALKRANGYSQEAIDRKRCALEGVLVPVTARWNEELLAGAGFRQVDCFWRWMNFAGWLALKDGEAPCGVG
jgi:tRNA (cmo5U34)-methyltransferase